MSTQNVVVLNINGYSKFVAFRIVGTQNVWVLRMYVMYGYMKFCVLKKCGSKKCMGTQPCKYQLSNTCVSNISVAFVKKGKLTFLFSMFITKVINAL